ncbi:MAG: hypothetical protein ACYCSJ_07600 [Acidimicrobiales bacterium]
MPVPDPLDEYPIHQAAVSMRQPATSDRNFYDRCIMHCFSPDGSVLLMTGVGIYPNLGVMDAYATIRRGPTQISVRASDPLGPDRLAQVVGPIRIEVVEPLRRLRAICDAPERGLAFDLSYEATTEALEEPLHVMRSGGRVILEGRRFVQLGTWQGSISMEGEDMTVTAGHWLGDRDRSWGIRPVGEAEPTGRPLRHPDAGIWWVWAPLHLPTSGLMVVAQEEMDGHRSLNQAVRFGTLASGGGEQQLGWPRFQIRYRPGTRHPDRVSVQMTGADGTPVEAQIVPVNGISLNIGCGYGADPEWTHGQWKGEGWVDSSRYDLSDPDVVARSAFSLIDHVATVRIGDEEGMGIFEHGCLGRHDPSGFAGWESMEAGL